MAGSTLGSAVNFDTDVSNGVNDIVGIDPDVTKDKLWLLSYYEAYKITGSTAADSGARGWDSTYWLRSPSLLSPSNVISNILASGTIRSDEVQITRCARPAFKISF